VIYEARDCETGEVLAVFRCQQGDKAAGTLLRLELGHAGMSAAAASIRLRRADPERWPQVVDAAFHWLPKEHVPHG
jgi:hypothetical protein